MRAELIPLLSFAVASSFTSVFAATSPPKVHLDHATFYGVRNGSTAQFLSIPFAQPPVGDLRFRLPQPILPYNGTHNATDVGAACIQQLGAPQIPDDFPNATKEFFASFGSGSLQADSEDCLTLNVIVPTNITHNDRIPVAVWIYPGRFQVGSDASTPLYNTTLIVDHSIQLGEPVILVAINYRVSALGFPMGKEVKDAGIGNLGLHDQREALRWVQKYISAFGGDPRRVTIWGQSAGAMSVAMQMVANGGDTEGLFHAAFSESGSPLPVGDLSKGQQYYDALVQDAGCAGTNDTLDCLRHVDLDALRSAIAKSPSIWSYQSLSLAWLPRVDGALFKDDPQRLIADGKVARVPMINGDCDDEGTMFALASLNITTDDQFEEYVSTYYLRNGSASELEHVWSLYPSDPTQGSPFDTALENAYTPEFKRISAFLGDIFFQGPRRYFLQHQSSRQPTWSYDSKRMKTLPILGATHVTDVSNMFGGGDLTDFLVNFVNHHNPNGKGGHIVWPKYTPATPHMLTLADGNTTETITEDTFRKEAISTLTKVTLEYPL